MSDEAQQRAAVVDEAMTWIGTSYHHHGRIRGVGVDCAQLLCAVFEKIGLVPPIDPGNYPVDWHLHRSEEVFSEWMAKLAKPCVQRPPALGDTILFRFGRTFSHGSIYVGDSTVIHAYIGRGVILSRLDEEPIGGRETQHWSFW